MSADDSCPPGEGTLILILAFAFAAALPAGAAFFFAMFQEKGSGLPSGWVRGSLPTKPEWCAVCARPMGSRRNRAPRQACVWFARRQLFLFRATRGTRHVATYVYWAPRRAPKVAPKSRRTAGLHVRLLTHCFPEQALPLAFSLVLCTHAPPSQAVNF